MAWTITPGSNYGIRHRRRALAVLFVALPLLGTGYVAYAGALGFGLLLDDWLDS